jgi:hypothetical protein
VCPVITTSVEVGLGERVGCVLAEVVAVAILIVINSSLIIGVGVGVCDIVFVGFIV